jgi:hypothetical protein
MRPSALPLLAAILLAACATALPPHDPGKAWIEVRGDPAIQLGADQLDGRSWADRRYFQVEPGEHRLQVRLGFEVPGGSGPDNHDGGGWRTCILEVRYGGFAAGARYRLSGRAIAHRAVAQLQDERGQTLARARVLRCGAL